MSRTRKEWTPEQAKAAQERFVARGGRRFGDPHSPLSQWRAMHDLDELEARFQRGERYALALALRDCANHGLPMPAWVAEAYIAGFDRVHTYQADSWEAVLGPAIPKGKHLKTLRKQFELPSAVWLEIERRHKLGKAIDDIMFAGIGKKLGISITTVKEYYKLEKDRIAAERAALDEPGNPIGELLRPYQKPRKK